MDRRTHRHRDIDTPGNASAASHARLWISKLPQHFDIRPDILTIMVSHNNCWTHGGSTNESFPNLVFAACIRASRKTHKSCSQPDRCCPYRNPEGRSRCAQNWRCSQRKPRIRLSINLSSTCKGLQAQCFICLDMLVFPDETNSSSCGEFGRWLSRWQRRTKSPGQDLSILISWCIYAFWHPDILKHFFQTGANCKPPQAL